jgi:cytochrome b involved in lipid metabolism
MSISIRRFTGYLRLFVCIAVAAATLLGTADMAAAASVWTGLPQIKSFSASPMVLQDGASAIYSFEVSNATSVQLIEAGEVIREINNPPSTSCKGNVKGRTTYQIPRGAGNSFEAVLLANNTGGSQQRMLTLSFATSPPVTTAARITTPSDNASTGPRKPEWLGQTSLAAPGGPSGQIVASYPPAFEKCPKGCDYCLQPNDAAARGFTNQCSKGPCYYAPDKQQFWYCYSKPNTVWCCLNGKVVETTREACIQKGGTAYATEAEALKSCQTTTVWCCLDGKVIETTREACVLKSGTAYTTEADALKGCQSRGWCCEYGKVGQTLQSTCLQSGGKWFLTEKEAVDACSTEIWCCRDGKVMQTSRELCAQMGGSSYSTQSDATKECQETAACWCCASGKVYQSTTAQCAQYGGSCYTSQTEATRYCQAAQTCWCCANGKVFQSTASQCAQYGGNCYTSQTEATRYCQAAQACWCCANGNVYQSTATQCTQYGGKCYSSQSEATKSCVVFTRPPILQ